MKAIILTMIDGSRVGVVPARWEAAPQGGSFVRDASDGGVLHVVENFDEIANALDALHILEKASAGPRAKEIEVASAQQAELAYGVATARL